MSIETASLAPVALAESASAISALGDCRDDIERLDDASLTEGMRILSEHERELQKYKLWMAAAIARRSHHELGYDGLARRSGSATPAIFIQKLTGSSLGEATKLARLGSTMVDDEFVPSGIAPVTSAAASGEVTLDAADAIRRGLGTPDAAVTAEQLATAAESLIKDASGIAPEALLKAARLRRAELDVASVERGEKERRDARYVRIWQRDGMSGGSWALPDEDGGLEINAAMKLLLASRTGGPRFVEKPSPTPDSQIDGTALAPGDTRSLDHILADGFATIFHNGITADPTIVPGAGRAAVRVIVTEQKLNTMLVGGIPNGGIQNLALIEDTQAPISKQKLSEYLCGGGTISVTIDSHGEAIDVGREQRLFTVRQRVALGVRDGGCRFPGCEKPPSWCEAHHVEQWARDHGSTDVRNGILLCRYHHMLVHNRGWAIIRDGGGAFWLKPPKDDDLTQKLVPMPSKNPLIRTMQPAHATTPTRPATG